VPDLGKRPPVSPASDFLLGSTAPPRCRRYAVDGGPWECGGRTLLAVERELHVTTSTWLPSASRRHVVAGGLVGQGVSELARARDLAIAYPSLAPDAPAEDAARLLAEEAVEGVFVPDEHGALQGVVSDTSDRLSLPVWRPAGAVGMNASGMGRCTSTAGSAPRPAGTASRPARNCSRP
jgi:hypothetical protein